MARIRSPKTARGDRSGISPSTMRRMAMQEFLLRGRERKYLDFYWDTFAYNPQAVSESERREYARGYEGPGGLNALKYYQNHWTDAEHNREFAKEPLKMPVLAFGGVGVLRRHGREGMRGAWHEM